MPLQIRRGTEAERLAMTVPLAEGELLYVTDDQRLYLGAKTPQGLPILGGIQITGYTNEDAQDATAALFASGTHAGIAFAYNDIQNSINATIDLSTYNGPIDGDLTGSVFADNSTRLVDGVSGRINLNGTIDGHVIPDQNSVYDLGSSANKFRDLYLSGSTIFLGDAPINSIGSVVNLPAGSTINGVVISSGDGVIAGSNYNINIVGDDSSLIVNSSTRTVTAAGGFVGTINTGNTIIASTSLTSSDAFFLGTAASPLDLGLNLSENFRIRQLINPAGGTGYVTTTQSRGTIASPTAAQAGDELGGLLIRAFTDSSTSAIAGIIGVAVDPTATIAGGNFIKSQIILSAATDTSQDPTNALIIDSAGVTTSNAFVASKFMQLAVYSDDNARSTAIPSPAAGMIVFMTAGTVPTVSNKPVIYNGTAWEAF